MPDEEDRYFLMPMLDGWTNVFQVPGKRTTGNKAQKYAITGPGWKGELPEGVKESSRRPAWCGSSAAPTAPARRRTTRPCTRSRTSTRSCRSSAYGKPYTPPAGKVDPAIDMKTPVREQVNRMDAATYFKLLATLMKDNPPAKADAPMVEKMAKIGIVPGKDFDISKLDPTVAKGLAGRPEGRRRRRSWPTSPKAGVERQRLAVHDEDRRLRHRVPPAGLRHRDRPRRQPAAGRGLSDLGGGRATASRTTAPTST